MLFEFATCKGKGYFVTLTYDDDNLPLWEVDKIKNFKTDIDDVKIIETEKWKTTATLDFKDVQKMFKRLRKNYPRVKFKYFVVGEYGSITQRPHYHVLIFGDMPYADKIIERSWNMGSIKVGTISTASIRYCCKYMMKDCASEDLTKLRRPTMMTSSKYFGAEGMFMDFERIADNGYIINQEGHKVAIPRYFRERYPETFGKEFNDEIAIIKKYNLNITISNSGHVLWESAPSGEVERFLECQQIEMDEMIQKERNLQAKILVDKKRYLGDTL